MSEQFYNAKKLRQYFGWNDTIRFMPRILSGQMGAFKSSRYNRTFHLRPNTKDFDTFRQVFFLQQYAIEFPFTPYVIIDGGANVGLSALYFNWRFPDANIFCYEASKDNYLALLNNIAPFPNIQAVNKGIWNRNTYLDVIDEGHGEDSFTVRETIEPSDKSIEAVSINDIINSYHLDVIDILKLDIEGAEREVFSSNIEPWISKCKCIIVELHDNMRVGSSKAVFKTISQFDFSTSIKDENLVFWNRNFTPLQDLV